MTFCATSLNGFEKKPSEGVWKGISSALPGNSLLSILSSKILWSVMGMLVFVAVIFIYRNDFYSVNENSGSAGQSISPLIIDQPLKQEAESNENTLITPEQNRIGIEKEKRKLNDNSENNIVSGFTLTKLDKGSATSANRDQQQQRINDVLAENPQSANLKKEAYLLSGYYLFLMKKTFDELVVPENYASINPDYINYRNPTHPYHLPGVHPATHDDYGKKGNLLYGIHIVPEFIFPGNDQVNKELGIELTGRYLMNDFYLESGLGFTISEEDGNFTIDYEQYDSVGYYYKVNSFSIDESSGQPVFNTDLEAVFDTVNYTASEVTRNTYTYLYLPLYAGIKLYEFKKLSLNLQSGIIYSIMISQSEPDASYSNDKATQITISNENSSRITSNWLVSGSLGLHYQINPAIGLNIEPMIKYYLKPVYEQRYDPKATFGAGVRVGMYFKF